MDTQEISCFIRRVWSRLFLINMRSRQKVEIYRDIAQMKRHSAGDGLTNDSKIRKFWVDGTPANVLQVGKPIVFLPRRFV